MIIESGNGWASIIIITTTTSIFMITCSIMITIIIPSSKGGVRGEPVDLLACVSWAETDGRSFANPATG